MVLPIIETERLILRPLRESDAADFLALAGDLDVARMTSDIPHPLLPEHAKAWLKPAIGDRRFAIQLQSQMIGSVGYFRRRSGAAELGFWLGRDHWGYGFATEAATAVVRHGFGPDGYTRFSSAYFRDNVASGNVLGKLGFAPIGSAWMWCAARGVDVEAIGVELTRERAAALLGAMPSPPAERHTSRPATRFGRWLDHARKALRDHPRP